MRAIITILIIAAIIALATLFIKLLDKFCTFRSLKFQLEEAKKELIQLRRDKEALEEFVNKLSKTTIEISGKDRKLIEELQKSSEDFKYIIALYEKVIKGKDVQIKEYSKNISELKEQIQQLKTASLAQGDFGELSHLRNENLDLRDKLCDAKNENKHLRENAAAAPLAISNAEATAARLFNYFKTNPLFRDFKIRTETMEDIRRFVRAEEGWLNYPIKIRAEFESTDPQKTDPHKTTLSTCNCGSKLPCKHMISLATMFGYLAICDDKTKNLLRRLKEESDKLTVSDPIFKKEATRAKKKIQIKNNKPDA